MLVLFSDIDIILNETETFINALIVLSIALSSFNLNKAIPSREFPSRILFHDDVLNNI